MEVVFRGLYDAEVNLIEAQATLNQYVIQGIPNGSHIIDRWQLSASIIFEYPLKNRYQRHQMGAV